MVESSKILTVSYGTFSCTLEGFEDSFSTMKAIAEYFRDLAAGDRYFGAEPPTPDVEMLSRIAEREIARKVDARTSETGIHLRATPQDDTAPAMPPQPVRPAAVPALAALAAAPDVVAPETDDRDTSVATDMPEAETLALDTAEEENEVAAETVSDADMLTQDHVETTDASDDESDALGWDLNSDPFGGDSADDAENVEAFATFAPARELPAHPDPDSVAAKLQRIRAVVGKSDPMDEELFAEDLQTDPTSDQSAFAEPVETAETVPVDAMQDDEADAVSDDLADDDADDLHMDADDGFDPASLADFENALSEVDAAEESTAAQADEVIDNVDVAEDIMPHEAIMEEDDGETVEADPIFDAPDQIAARADDAISALMQQDRDEGEAVTDSDDTDETEAQISKVLRNLERAGATIPDQIEIRAKPVDHVDVDGVTADEIATSQYDTEVDSAKPTLRARILRVAKRVVPAAPAETEARDDTEMADSTPADDQIFAEIAAEASSDTFNDPIADAAAKEARLAAGEDIFDDADIDVEDDMVALDDSDDFGDFDNLTADALPDDDEAELLAELDEAAQDAAVAATRSARHGRNVLPAADDAAMARIMDQAEEELSDPESSRRRAAIAQLKAAVAATEAARQLGENKSGDAAREEEAFRDDLSQVVRPRRAPRPEGETARSERPRPAPLKLVASQRVDMATRTGDTPVQPRRIAMAEAVTQSDASSFAEFAEQMGASELPDLLEAAAAYTAYVEGVTDFSRPQIMKKVQATTDKAITREDGLRSFGTLLRQGRISKSGNGRFQISEQTRFKPEQMAG